jgi:hypothetical protein
VRNRGVEVTICELQSYFIHVLDESCVNRFSIPQACPVERHVGSYKRGVPSITNDATGLYRGASRSLLWGQRANNMSLQASTLSLSRSER